ncbi:MAG: DUF4199 domain-containing protein, partial [Acidobacteriota bacterium]
MKRSILIFGAIAGAIIFGTMCLGFVIVGPEGTVGGPQWLGFLVMLLGFSVIFVAVKQHRERDLGGVIKFGRAFLLGLGITMVASLLYTIGIGATEGRPAPRRQRSRPDTYRVPMARWHPSTG